MAKLYFRYGTMGSAKTLNLLAVAHNYRSQKKEVLLLKPALDDRFGRDLIQSRAGLHQEADFLVQKGSRLEALHLQGISCVLVDESQFLDPTFVEHLHAIARDFDIPVICYGLRTDFQRKLFPGSQRLLELADSIEEVKNTCHYCNRKAIFNMRTRAGMAVIEGPQIELGREDKYLPVCSSCYEARIQEAHRAEKLKNLQEAAV
jgi:thymidine kinase